MSGVRVADISLKWVHMDPCTLIPVSLTSIDWKHHIQFFVSRYFIPTWGSHHTIHSWFCSAYPSICCSFKVFSAALPSVGLFYFTRIKQQLSHKHSQRTFPFVFMFLFIFSPHPLSGSPLHLHFDFCPYKHALNCTSPLLNSICGVIFRWKLPPCQFSDGFLFAFPQCSFLNDAFVWWCDRETRVRVRRPRSVVVTSLYRCASGSDRSSLTCCWGSSLSCCRDSLLFRSDSCLKLDQLTCNCGPLSFCMLSSFSQSGL